LDKVEWGGTGVPHTEEPDLTGRRELLAVQEHRPLPGGASLTPAGQLLPRHQRMREGIAVDAEYTEVLPGFTYRPVRSNRVQRLMRCS
jgi:hypothetical protein